MQIFAPTIINKMFHSDYKHIIGKLPESFVKKVYHRLLPPAKANVYNVF